MTATVDPALIDLALQLADASGPVVLDYFRTNTAVERKGPKVPHLGHQRKRGPVVIRHLADAVFSQEDLGQFQVVAQRVASGGWSQCAGERPETRQDG